MGNLVVAVVTALVVAVAIGRSIAATNVAGGRRRRLPGPLWE